MLHLLVFLESATRARRPLTHARALLAEAPDVLANAKHTTATDDFEAHKNTKNMNDEE